MEFCGGGAGTFRLTWAQEDFWRKVIRRYGDESRYFNIAMVVDLAGGAVPDRAVSDQAAVIAALRQLVARNQVLRTHFLEGPDGPRQRIEGSGTFVVRIRRSTPEACRPDADALAAELAAAAFDHGAEWGIRLGLVCAGRSPVHLVFAISHLLADGSGVRALVEDFFDLMRVQATGGCLTDRWQPADQAVREQSGGSGRRNQAAIRYWRRQLERIPPSMFAFPAKPPEQPRFHSMCFESRALAVAAARLASRCQVSVPSVVLAGAALGLCAVTGQLTCVLMPVCGNRHDSGLRGMVGLTAQHGLLVIDLAGISTVAEAVRAAHRAATAAYFYGYCDPVAVQDLIDEVETARGVRFDLSLLYNDLTAFLDEPADTGPAGQALELPEADARGLLAESTLILDSDVWQGQIPTMYLATEQHQDFCRLRLVADSACLPARTTQALLRGIERTLLDAAYREVHLPRNLHLPRGTSVRRRSLIQPSLDPGQI